METAYLLIDDLRRYSGEDRTFWVRPDKDFESPHRGRWRRDESNRPFSTFQGLRLGETANTVSSHLGPFNQYLLFVAQSVVREKT